MLQMQPEMLQEEPEMLQETDLNGERSEKGMSSLGKEERGPPTPLSSPIHSI